MDEIITDAELHQADGWIDEQRVKSRQAQLVHWALLELKIRRDVDRTTRSKPVPSLPSVRAVNGRSI